MAPKSRQVHPRVAEFEAVKDPVERAAACQQFLANARETIRLIERLRDDSIREARKSGRGTIDEVAQSVGVKRNVVVNALRGAK